MSEKALIRAQAISGLIFALFLVLHLANTAAAALGQDVYDTYMGIARLYYQSPLVEIVGVLGAVIVHAGVGLVRIWRRRHARQGHAVGWRLRLHRYSAYVLLAIIAGHVVSTPAPDLMGHTPDYSFVHFSLNVAGWFFYPYYAVFTTMAVYHMLHGSMMALRVMRVKIPTGMLRPRSRRFMVLAGVGITAVLVGLLALGGNIYTPDALRFDEWQRLYDQALPWVPKPW